jgi:hypothetical protein
MITLGWLTIGALNAWSCYLIMGALRVAPYRLAHAEQLVTWVTACAAQGVATPRNVWAARWTRRAFRGLVAGEVVALGVSGAAVLYSAWRLLGGTP